MNFHFLSLLLAMAAFLGVVVGVPLGDPDDIIHEYIPRDDGTMDHFAYHSSFVPNTNVDVNLTAAGLAKNMRIALDNGNISGGLATALSMFDMPDHIRRILAHNLHSGSNLDLTNPGSPDSNAVDINKRLDKPFIGSSAYQNTSFCGFPAPFPDWNNVGFLNRPDTYDCARLLEMWLHRFGYFQLTGFGGASETDWSFLTLYNSCEMDVRRLDFENQWGARVGSFDITAWVAAAMLVSIGKDFEDPEAIKYMASISGSVGCQEIGPNPIALLEFDLIRNENSPQPTGVQATQTPTLAPLPSVDSLMLTRPTPTTFPNVASAASATTITSAFSYVYTVDPHPSVWTV